MYGVSQILTTECWGRCLRSRIFHGDALVPPVGYIDFTAANGSNYEQLTISNLTAIVAPQ
jgi:hypothetical protein